MQEEETTDENGMGEEEQEQEACEEEYKPKSWEEERNSHFEAYKAGWEAAWTVAGDMVEEILNSLGA